MSAVRVNFYVCPGCGRQWREFRRGPRDCPGCGRHFDVALGGKDDVMKYAMPMSRVAPDGALVVLEEA